MLTDCFSCGYLSNDDLRLLFRSIGGADTVATPRRVQTVRALAMDDLFFVDVGMWQETLGGMEAVVLIPLVCAVLYGYKVPVTSSGMMGFFLYQELKMAISRQPIPRQLAPLTWTFAHVVTLGN